MVSDPIRSDGLPEEYLDGARRYKRNVGGNSLFKPGWRWVQAKIPKNETDSINEKGLGGEKTMRKGKWGSGFGGGERGSPSLARSVSRCGPHVLRFLLSCTPSQD
jgi:hypothetical protein